MTFKKAEMAKTLRNGLSMIETNPLNHMWSDFVILSGLSLHRFQKKLLLRVIFYQWPKLCIGLDVEANIQILKGIYCKVIYNEKRRIMNYEIAIEGHLPPFDGF